MVSRARRGSIELCHSLHGFNIPVKGEVIKARNPIETQSFDYSKCFLLLLVV